jgi:tripartite-type tricarboxylate transporter receptor subunit TctC
MKTRIFEKLALWFLAVLFLVAVTPEVKAQPGEFVNGVLQPLADGFPKRAITIVNADDPGSRDGITARMLQKVLKGISPVPIVVSDEPAPSWSTWSALKDILSREGGDDGYYPLLVTLWGGVSDLHCEPIEKELGLGVNDLNVVILTELIPYVFSQRKNAPWGPSFADMVKFAKANPGQLKYISNEVGSGNDVAAEWVIQQLGIKVNKIPQAGQQEGLSVIGAGRGDFGCFNVHYTKINWDAGRIDVTMIMAPTVPPPWDKDPNCVPMVKAGLPDVPMGNSTAFGVHSKVPQSHADWLFKLFKAGASTNEYKDREKTNPGLKITIMDGAAANKLKMDLYNRSETVIRGIGLHWDQQKKK